MDMDISVTINLEQKYNTYNSRIAKQLISNADLCDAITGYVE